MSSKAKFLLFILSSILVGIINGIFGGGGGMLCVPLLKIFLKFDDKQAHATTVFIMAIISIPTIIVYITTLSFSLINAILLTIGVLFGGLIGSKLLKTLNNKTINIIFILIMFVSGIKMIF